MNETPWLVTGGAGYIGSHVVRALSAAGLRPIVIDDLSTGRSSTVPDHVELVHAPVHDTELLTNVLRRSRAAGVLHLAAKKSPSESVANPLYYYEQNVDGLRSVLSAMTAAGTSRIVLSSSCAVYGLSSSAALMEDEAPNPVSPYGRTKVISEWLVEDAARARGIDFVNLRYFNVAGNVSRDLADPSATNLVPMALSALLRGENPRIFGADYPTPDGTCIRDYVHVGDVAHAHAVAAVAMMSRPLGRTYNIGTGRGSSVREVMATIREVTGVDFTPVVDTPRQGDPARAVGDVSRIAAELGWHSRYDLDAMVRSAWDAMKLTLPQRHVAAA